jgi:hypothetical protein
MILDLLDNDGSVGPREMFRKVQELVKQVNSLAEKPEHGMSGTCAAFFNSRVEALEKRVEEINREFERHCDFIDRQAVSCSAAVRALFGRVEKLEATRPDPREFFGAGEAVTRIIEGKKVRRASWSNKSHYWRADHFFGITPEELFATDYYEVEE